MKGKKHRSAKRVVQRKSKAIIICRCEEITDKEILQTIKNGFQNLEEIKRILRCGMGHCQGRNCLNIIARMISRETGIPVENIKLPTSRSPLKPVPLEVLAHYQNE